MAACEVELKFEFCPADRGALEHLIAAHSDGCARHRLASIYFDTPQQTVRRHGFSLRVRKRGPHHVQTIKADEADSAGLFAREEWERPVPGERPVLDGDDQPLTAAIGRSGLSKIAPAFACDVERASWDVSFEGAQVEASIDHGEISAGAIAARICELELELKGGSPRALFDLARRLDGEVPLRLGVRSKADRGYRLLDASPPRAAKAEPVPLDPAMSAGEAFRRIAMLCVRQYRLNEAVLLERHDPECVHQARVALRRLRTAFSLFKPLFAGDESAALIKAEARLLATGLGDVRNLDVLSERLGKRAPAALRDARDRAFEHVRAELLSARSRLLLLDLLEWSTLGDWRARPADARLLNAPIPDVAAGVLDRARKRFRRAADGLSTSSEQDCHATRIAAKKLRYASEFFASLCTTPKARRRHAAWLAAIEAVQDRLGALNDIVVGERILADLGKAPKRSAADTAMLAGLRTEADRSSEALAAAKPFWRGWA